MPLKVSPTERQYELLEIHSIGGLDILLKKLNDESISEDEKNMIKRRLMAAWNSCYDMNTTEIIELTEETDKYRKTTRFSAGTLFTDDIRCG